MDQKLITAFAAKEAQFEEKLSTTLKEKDSEIAKPPLWSRKIAKRKRRQRIKRKKAEERQSYARHA